MTFHWRTIRSLIVASGALLLAATSSNVIADDDQEAFFETSIRPLLVDNCLRCHGPEKQEGGLRLDSLDAILAGGDRGAAMTPGEPANSIVIEAINYSPDLQMPPDGQLEAEQIAHLTQWIELGAYWPESVARITLPAEEHWAFQPVQAVEPPDMQGDFWVHSPIDAFVLAKLNVADLRPNAPADRRTLIRRAYYALTGLPPSPEEVDRFVNDADPNAYECLIENLLVSPHYGEQWARHWLDVARYSDSKGYVYGREERFWVHAWTYRDWVVNALNSDMPYDRFLLLQIAADQVADRGENDLAAMGFLTIGRRFLGIERDIVDDRIDVVCRGTMGLTVACARCHDHKYDPIPTADYYSLYGVFESSREQLVPIGLDTHGDEAFQVELAKRQQAHADAMQANRVAASTRARGRVGDYLLAQLELHKFPAQGFDQLLDATILIPDFVRYWQTYLQDAERNHDPLWIPWLAYRALPEEQFATLASDVTAQLHAQAEAINPLVLEAFATPPASMVEVAQRYGTLLTDIETRWQAKLAEATAAGAEPPTQFDNPSDEQLRRVLYGPGAPCEVPEEPLVHSEYFFDTEIVVALWGTQGEVDRWIINAPFDAPYALTLEDCEQPAHPYIFLRGNPQNLGAEVPRQFLTLLSGDSRQPFQQGSGRYELAQAIIDPANPLTARVIVNRVWAHHFGVGLVDTPSDFGTRAETPSHPELLDWLAAQFIEHGWSLKWLHREIMLTSTYQQASSGTDDDVLATALQIDPDNRLLWRMNPRRLSFEEIRDSMLAAGGNLDLTPGGRASEIFTPPFPTRRTLYGRVDRQFLPSTLRMFDFANPDLHIPQRSETTVPQQALFLMNHPLVLERAKALAALVPDDAAADVAIRTLFQRVYQRDPTEAQLASAIAFLQTADATETSTPPATAADWQYGYGPLDEAAGRVISFTPLPHFTGAAWQGGESWPDGTLGWVQLTATGGHPGNDREHAAIRRWTAPRAMTVAITSQLKHELDVGDGVRIFIISSRAGVLANTTIRYAEQELNVPALAVEQGETIDFLVDIGNELNTDQHLWEATLTEQPVETATTSQPLSTWNSRTDFPTTTTHQLAPLEQLAQLLLCSNEFVFVD